HAHVQTGVWRFSQSATWTGRGIVMLRLQSEAPCGLRWGAFSVAILVALTAVSSDPADARSRRKRGGHHYRAAHAHLHHQRAKVAGARAPRSDSLAGNYAAIVVDANSGNVLHAASADALRHPASLTKIMTLYMLFERLDAGTIKLDTQLP